MTCCKELAYCYLHVQVYEDSWLEVDTTSTVDACDLLAALAFVGQWHTCILAGVCKPAQLML